MHIMTKVLLFNQYKNGIKSAIKTIMKGMDRYTSRDEWPLRKLAIMALKRTIDKSNGMMRKYFPGPHLSHAHKNPVSSKQEITTIKSITRMKRTTQSHARVLLKFVDLMMILEV
jgi:hypothetical protein